MPATARLSVQVVGWTQFGPPPDVPWETDADGGAALAEFAGRACYQSWDKPNPATDTNASYLRHLLEVGHLAVLEHATVTFYVTGVSRALAAELPRHRHLSFSQLSPRHVPDDDVRVVEPAAVGADPELHALFAEASDAALAAYRALLAGLGTADPATTSAARRQARQMARSLLPGALETRLVMTGNHRALRHFVAMRASEHADSEVRELAVAVLLELQRIAPSVFGDFVVSQLPDGTRVASSPLVGEG